ncbi:cuticle protein 38-like [Lucilia sericata]|uniref:cuticle protein 38-like n=1 Tax=Lucilia sericata TaxID=13632 RepID=UPI0018A86745|nr:cuticle protein 38-like [Lucilia sericata]
MFKLIAVFSAIFAVASAGYLGGYGLSAPAYHTSVVAAPVVHAAPVIKTYAAPAVVHAPLVKAYAPVATSYANTYKISQRAYPVVHAAPAVVAAPVIKSYAAPVYAAPAYGLGHGLSYGHAGYGHSIYH